MTIKISLLGEGTEDYGTLSGKDKPDSMNGKHKGHIQMFLERILKYCKDRNIHFQPYPIDPRELHQHAYMRKERYKELKSSAEERRIQNNKMEPLAVRTRLAIQKACSLGHQAIVVLMDDRREDDKPILEKLKKGSTEAEQEGFLLPTALGTAVKEIETWILADDKARPYGLGDQFGKQPLPVSPEQIDDPKSLFRERYGQYYADLQRKGNKELPSEMECKEAIIVQIDIAELAKLCPEGFKPFLIEIKEHILPVFEKK